MTAAPEPPATDEEPLEYICWDRPGKSIQEFRQSRAFVRVLIGGRGSGKTSGGTCMEAIRHIWHNAGSKAIFLRKTEASQASSTIETLFKAFENLGPLYQENAQSLFRVWNGGAQIRIPSELAVKKYNEFMRKTRTKGEIQYWLDSEGERLCGKLEMKGLPESKIAESKLRGFECSFMALIEADQIAERDFQLALACLRWKGADPTTCDANGFIMDACVILDTNPPSPRHWIAQLEEAQSKLPEDQREMEFWHISTYENEHNLPPGYIRRQILLPYANNPAMIKRMLHGQYAEAFDGDPVYYAFIDHEHAAENLPWPRGAYLIRGWDFGTWNSVVWSAYWEKDGVEYWHDLHEQYLEGSDTERQVLACLSTTEAEFPFWNDREKCAGVLDYCDPAGANSNFSASVMVGGTAMKGSSVTIMQSHGIFPGYSLWERSLQVTLLLGNRMLQKRDHQGRVCYRVDKKSCPILYRGLSGEYRYPKLGEPGYASGVPLKGDLCGRVDHVADANRYARTNCLRLLRAEHEATKPPKFANRQRNPNPDKRR